MDANKFGSFVAEKRKKLNMTQAELAAKICVTDKAVSRWERGLGFPDIKTKDSWKILWTNARCCRYCLTNSTAVG